MWNHQPIRLEHSMHNSPAFSMDAIARLIESYPREHYSLVKTGAKGSSRVWREGEIGNLSGRQVIDAISRGGLWLNMRNVGAIDSRYRQLVDKDDVEGFAENLVKLLDNQSLRARLGQAGLKRSETFNKDNLVASFTKLYMECKQNSIKEINKK